MPSFCVVTDLFEHPQGGGGTVVPTTPWFTVNGQPALVTGDQTVIHTNKSGTPHVATFVGTGFLTVGGKKVLQKDDVAGCTAKMLTASSFMTN